MKRCLVLGSLLGMVCLLAGCGLKDPRVQEYEVVAADLLYLFQELTKIMEGIEDEQTARAAMDKLDALNGKFEQVYQRYVNVPRMKQEEADDVEKRLEAGLKALEPRLEAATKKAQEKSGKNFELVGGAMERVSMTLEKFKKFDELNKQRHR